MSDDRSVGTCCICERDQHPNQVTGYFCPDVKDKALVICHDCIEQFEKDAAVKLENDILGQPEWEKLKSYVRLESKCEPEVMGYFE
jgi:hypothetical protein